MNGIRGIAPELLSPAGGAEQLCAALDYGADAVYLAGTEFGMRTASRNFDEAGLRDAAKQAHGRGARIYLTCNTVPRNGELTRLPGFLELVQDAGIDALIVTDLGVFEMARQYAPKVELHISTQAGVANYACANAFYHMGAARVVLARELTLEEIAEIRAKTPPELELEAFVHGAMCMSFSGRCLLSNYLTGRDANRGDCAQPCRWKYALMEEKRPGQYFPVFEDGRGSYLLNSYDMCMLEHIPKLLDAGVSSLKIEGRAKSAYYTAVVTNAYRAALDEAIRNPGGPLPAWIVHEADKISHRPYGTGFYLGGEPGQETQSGGYIREYEVIAVCESYQDGMAVLAQRNRFFRGDIADVLEPGGSPRTLALEEIFDENGVPIPSAPHAAMRVLLRTDTPLRPGAFLRKKRTGAQC